MSKTEARFNLGKLPSSQPPARSSGSGSPNSQSYTTSHLVSGSPLQPQQPRLIRFILLGESSVGKTCLLHRFCDGRFNERGTTPCTVGVDFKFKDIFLAESNGVGGGNAVGAQGNSRRSSNRIGSNASGGGENGETARLQIWDTAGQERFRVITLPYYRRADGVVLVYDVTRQATFAAVGDFLKAAREYCPLGTVCVLIGNKCDLAGEVREVTTAEGEKFAREQGIPIFFETSAKKGDYVDEAFEVLARHVILTQATTLALQRSIRCSLCGEKEAIFLCKTCDGEFCEDCQLIPHDKSAPTQVHKGYVMLNSPGDLCGGMSSAPVLGANGGDAIGARRVVRRSGNNSRGMRVTLSERTEASNGGSAETKKKRCCWQ